MWVYKDYELINLNNIDSIEDEATHSRDFSHELVATYIK